MNAESEMPLIFVSSDSLEMEVGETINFYKML